MLPLLARRAPGIRGVRAEVGRDVLRGGDEGAAKGGEATAECLRRGACFSYFIGMAYHTTITYQDFENAQEFAPPGLQVEQSRLIFCCDGRVFAFSLRLEMARSEVRVFQASKADSQTALSVLNLESRSQNQEW